MHNVQTVQLYNKPVPNKPVGGLGTISIQLKVKSPFVGRKNSILMALDLFTMVKSAFSFHPVLKISTNSYASDLSSNGHDVIVTPADRKIWTEMNIN